MVSEIHTGVCQVRIILNRVFDMRRLKSSLTILLMICMIGYGSAWAFESHADEADLTIALVGNQSVDQHSADSRACDHQCHASAHMLAMCRHTIHLFSSNKTIEPMEFSQSFTSFIVSPDLKPPRA